MKGEEPKGERKGGIATAGGGSIPKDKLMEMAHAMEEENARLDSKRPWYSWLWSWKE